MNGSDMHTAERETGATIGSAPLIEAHGLTKHYDSFSLRGIDLTVRPNEIVGLIGKNGAGKTTTIKALLGLIFADGGEASVLGAAPRDLSDGARSSLKERVGVVFDTVSVPDHLSVAEVGRIMANAFDRWDRARFIDYLKRFELEPDKRVKELSRGMSMKLSLACALSHDPDLLILDEATAGLDPLARDDVLDLLLSFVTEPGHAVLMSSHITSDLDKIADTVVCIDAGRIVFCLPKDDITDRAGIARCREVDLDAIRASGAIATGELRCLRHARDVDVLVPDRFAFMRQLPDIPCDRMTVDDYMALMLKGGDCS
ncbi:ABC transporter related protein [Coriobacterium glomerans PW2]|uniref:ABC transporter related protein n=1 Tax=Coriobacterium glomerans (strain ATCC 49209 / DSM 20642 / JCM 10262 / PW2) TaxID=700015 RepID=F2NA29_CORGP|nr:ABC transporter ATP-binding protein [Coriobacterium glomerans]AEB06423.1 ABC transporter related protein [Coriobacterium glomerans PW2]